MTDAICRFTRQTQESFDSIAKFKVDTGTNAILKKQLFYKVAVKLYVTRNSKYHARSKLQFNIF